MTAIPVILQISDTQFGPRFGFEDYTKALKSLTDDLNDIVKEGVPKPNIIVHCGDIADTGNDGEYMHALEFLQGLCGHLDIPHTRCILTPGNHDFDQSAKSQLQFDAFRDDLFLRFHSENGITYSREGMVYDLSNDFCLSILAWNSALDSPRAKIDCDVLSKRLNSLSSNRDLIKIFVVHHSPELIIDYTFNRVKDLLSNKGVSFYLHGHLHNHVASWSKSLVSTALPLFIVGTGSLSVNLNERPGDKVLGVVPNQYNIIKIDPKQRQATLFVRQHIPVPQPYGSWTKYCILSGKTDRLKFDLDKGNSLPQPSSPLNPESEVTVTTPRLCLCEPWQWTSQGGSRQSRNSSARVLVLSPHPDDVVQACSATILKLRERAGALVWIYNIAPIRTDTAAHVDRSMEAAVCGEFLLLGLNKTELQNRIQEAESQQQEIIQFCKKILNTIATSYPLESQTDLPKQLILGASNLGGLVPEIHDGDICSKSEVIQKILFDLKQKISPTIVLAPSPNDPHPEHGIIGRIADWVFRSQESVWHYELPKMEGSTTGPPFDPNLFINVATPPITNGTLADFSSYGEAKLFLFETVFRSKDGGKHWFDKTLFEGYLRMRAAQAFFPKPEVGIPYAEAFEARIFVETIDTLR